VIALDAILTTLAALFLLSPALAAMWGMFEADQDRWTDYGC
jgi:hypothetical protein